MEALGPFYPPATVAPPAVAGDKPAGFKRRQSRGSHTRMGGRNSIKRPSPSVDIGADPFDSLRLDSMDGGEAT